MTRRPALLALLALAACANGPSDDVKETAVNVLTLQSGTVADLESRRGQGPFREYDLTPGHLLDVVEAAARRARDAKGAPVRAVFRSDRYSQVVAKEPAPDDSGKDRYSVEWRSAMVAIVHPVAGEPDRSRLEIHATHRGPFHRGVVDWDRSMPRWIDEVLAARESRVLPIPDAPPAAAPPRPVPSRTAPPPPPPPPPVGPPR